MKLSSTSELDDAGGEWLEIGFADETTPCGNRGRGTYRYRVREREGVDLMHSCWVSYSNYPSAIAKKESKGSTAETVEVDNVRDLKKEPSLLSFSTLQ